MKIEQKTNCQIICGDSRKILKDFAGQVDLIVTSPPYADARRNHYDSIHPDKFAEWFLTFHEPFINALKPTGSLVLNIKDKIVNGVRHRYVWQTIEALSARGWFAIDDYLWHKTNPMPGYWPTRLRDGWEYCFHLAKSPSPYLNADAVRKPIGDWVGTRLAKLGQNDLSRHNSVNASGFGRNISKWVGKHTVLPSNVMSLPLVGKNRGHPAVFPLDLPLFFIKLLCPKDGLVIDPFAGSGTTGLAAISQSRRCVLIDNNAGYCQIARKRLDEEATPADDSSCHDFPSTEMLWNGSADAALQKDGGKERQLQVQAEIHEIKTHPRRTTYQQESADNADKHQLLLLEPEGLTRQANNRKRRQATRNLGQQ